MSAVLQLGVFQKFDGTRKSFVITTENLFTYNPSSLVLENVAGGYSGNLQKRASYDFFGNKMYFTNGVDPIQVWDGTVVAAEDTEGTVQKCDQLIQFFGHILAIKPTIGGSYFPQRIYSSDRDVAGWAEAIDSDATFFDIPEGQDHIVTAKRYSNYLAIYKQRSIHLVSYVGLPLRYIRQMVVPNREQ